MKNVLDTINHPKATPEKIKQMKDNGWTDQEIAEKFADFCKIQNLQNCQTFAEQAPFGTASQSSAARVRGLVEMLRTCEVHSSKPPSNETLCGISILLLREIFSVLNDEEIHR